MRILLLLLCLGVAACASRTERVITLASQGLAYDAYYHPTPGGNMATLTFLERRAAWLGVQVGYRPDGHEDLRGATGLSYRQGHEKHVVVSNTLSINGRIEVLAHEIAHLFQPESESRTASDVFAELVSIAVCQKLGVDSSRAAAGYLRGYKPYLHVGRVYAPEIAFITDLLTRGY